MVGNMESRNRNGLKWKQKTNAKYFIGIVERNIHRRMVENRGLFIYRARKAYQRPTRV